MLFPRFKGSIFEVFLPAAGRNMVHKPAPLPTVVHVGHGNVGEPHNGCHDGPAAHCTATGGIRWSKCSYMCLHVSNRRRVRLLDLRARSEQACKAQCSPYDLGGRDRGVMARTGVHFGTRTPST